MSIQPGRPMLAALRETLRKMECLETSTTPDQAELRRILRRRIAQMETIQFDNKRVAGR